MASLLKTPPFRVTPSPPAVAVAGVPIKSIKPFCVSFTGGRNSDVARGSLSCRASHRLYSGRSRRFFGFVRFASGETEAAETQAEASESEFQATDGAVGVESDNVSVEDEAEEAEASAVMAFLQSYKEALANNDETKVAEIEESLKSIEDEKLQLEKKMASLSEEMSVERDRVLRISADFDNFRKRTERERLSLMTNAQGEVVENLLPVLDNFERAKTQIKVETEGEEKINNSYQSIYKQFVEILASLGVVPVETVGKPFDPMLHEAIMREDSGEFEEGIILEEYRKGFKLGDRLLRPSMVKVSAGPGPAKPQMAEEKLEGEAEDLKEKTEEKK